MRVVCKFEVSATLNIFRWVYVLYSAGSGVNNVQVLLSGFSTRLYIFSMCVFDMVTCMLVENVGKQ